MKNKDLQPRLLQQQGIQTGKKKYLQMRESCIQRTLGIPFKKKKKKKTTTRTDK